MKEESHGILQGALPRQGNGLHRLHRRPHPCSDTVDACIQILARNCPEASPVTNPIASKYTFAELSFDRLTDEGLRRCIQELPTSFSLPRETVDLLRQVAAHLLMTSEPFIKAMQDLDPTWKPRQVVIDRGLIDAVCGGGSSQGS